MLFSSRVSVRIAVRIRFSVWLVSCYAHLITLKFYLLICRLIDRLIACFRDVCLWLQLPNDISYVFSGYAPLSVRLAHILHRPGWRSITEVLTLLPGPTTEEVQQVPGWLRKRRTPRTLLVLSFDRNWRRVFLRHSARAKFVGFLAARLQLFQGGGIL